MKPCSQIHPKWIEVFLFLVCIAMLPAMANAADADAPFAKVWRIHGEVTVTNKTGAARKLGNGGVVLVGERVSSSAKGEAVLKTEDAGMVAIRPNTEFIPERFSAQGKSTDNLLLRLTTGSLRIITGWIGLINRDSYLLVTPTSTIGIRGTDHEPYVLAAENASVAYRPGTYDKVNRGVTSLNANGGNLVIDSGKVGFARDANSSPIRTRALMTVFLPVLLSEIPNFYVPGAFEKELDQYSATADETARKQLEGLTGSLIQPTQPTPANPPAATATLTPAPPATQALSAAQAGCAPRSIAESWLDRLDRGIIRRDVKGILSLFAPDALTKAHIRNGKDSSTVQLNREDMVKSTMDSMAGLKDFQQRRVSIEATLAAGESADSCKRINVKSATIEQGLMNDKPFRFEALEDYVLELRNDQWLAIEAQTTQR